VAISPIDQKFLLQCEEVRPGSHDPHRTVGAVVADKNGSFISAGANRPPEALGLSRSDTLEQISRAPQSKYYLLEHAERNAIFHAYQSGAGDRLQGATMYCTLLPCADCARAIVASGIRRLVIPKQIADPVRDLKWSDHYLYANQIFSLAGVMVDTVQIPREGQTSASRTGS
jgi:dCMP deaminase